MQQVKSDKVIEWGPLLESRRRAQSEGKSVVWTNGCFDLLHVGHIRNLQDAPRQGDMLVVGLNSDDSVRRIKGPTRPIVPANQRAEVLAALECVDYVVIFDEPTAEASIQRLKPDIYCKSADYGATSWQARSGGGACRGVRRPHCLPAASSEHLDHGHHRAHPHGRSMIMARAIFLDRDGTVIQDVGYPRDPNQVQLLPGVADALKRLQEHGFALVVVSNQSGIGRALVTIEEASAVHARFVDVLKAHGITLNGAYYCPHSPEADCRCRKPATELFHTAEDELDLELYRSFMVGDKPSDTQAGRRAGCRTVFFNPNATSVVTDDYPDFVAGDWDEIADWILLEAKAGR